MAGTTISKEYSYIIKGIAILLMLIHHFFTFPRWIVSGGYSPNLLFAELFNSPTKLCVCIFAFVSGWAFALQKMTYKKAVDKIKKLYVNYWCIAIPAILLAIFICNFELSIIDIGKELLGLNSSVMIFAWYVPFYAVSLFAMAIIQRLLDKNTKIALFVGVFVPIVLFTIMKRLPIPSEIQTLFNNLRHWFPCIAIGYISNKYNWFEKINCLRQKLNHIFVSIVLIILCFVGRYYISGLDFIYCLLLVFAIVNLKININSFVGRSLYICGKNSTNMWFLHCLYFGDATRELVQPLAYWAKYPLLIYIVAVLELLGTSGLINWIKKKIADSFIVISHKI